MRADKSSLAEQLLQDRQIRRIRREIEENNAIYGKRDRHSLSLFNIHYGHAKMLEWAFRQMTIIPGSRVLDVGVGEGHSSVRLALAGARVTGIDVSDRALEHAQELARRSAVDVEFRQMPGEDLQFEDESFDAILCMSAYHHMDLDRAAREFSRVLRPGGKIVMIEPLATNPPAWLYRRVGRALAREATSEETPLHVGDLAFLNQHFREVRWEGIFFLSVFLFGLDRLGKHKNRFLHPLTEWSFRWVFPLDTLILKIPGLQRIAWKIGIVADR